MSDVSPERVLTDIAELKARADAGSYLALASELSTMNDRLKSALPQMALADASRVMQAFYPLVFTAMIELSETDEAVRAKLQRASDVYYVLRVDEVEFALCLALQKGKFSFQMSHPERADVTMTTSPEALVRIMTGQTDALEAFMDGEVDAEGSLIKARGLRLLMEFLSQKFGVTLMEFSS